MANIGNSPTPSSDAIQRRHNRLLLASEMLRYFLAAIVNNIVGYLTFLVALWLVHLNPYLSNITAYVVGLLSALLLNRYYVFVGVRIDRATIVRFLISFGLAFALNQAALFVLFKLLFVRPEIAQIGAMCCYAGGFYLLNKLFVWKR